MAALFTASVLFTGYVRSASIVVSRSSSVKIG